MLLAAIGSYFISSSISCGARLVVWGFSVMSLDFWLEN